MIHVSKARTAEGSIRSEPLLDVPARLVVTLEDRGDSRTPGRFRAAIVERPDVQGDDERVLQRR